MQEERFDLVVIGSGPAGEKGAAQAAYFGKRVAIIERESRLGGAAANTGTLPSKTLRETSVVLSGLRSRNLYGVDLSLRRQATIRDLMTREVHVTEIEGHRIAANIGRHKIEVVHGNGSFVDPHTIAVKTTGGETRHLRADVILIATGSSPRRPEGFVFDDPRIHDSDEILRIDRIPQELVVIGAGVIGCEYACTFAALGTKVFLIDKREIPLGFLDEELSRALAQAMRELGVNLCMPDEMLTCTATPEAVITRLKSGRELRSDGVLVAAGRSSNTAGLNLEAAGIKPGKYGLLEVNARYQTAVPHIYAAGDVIGFPALASTSMEQARLAMVSAFDLKYKTSVAEVLPYGIYTIPELSMAGATEEELKLKGIAYVCGRAKYANNARGTIIGDESGFLKLIFARDDMRLLGVHVIGELATEVVHIGLMALMMHAGADLFIKCCFNYPTLSELYKYATYDALGQRARASEGSKP